MTKIVTIVGARPQFIKASVVSRAFLKSGQIDEFILHTGQHYDLGMSEVFFNQLGIPRPGAMLDINGGSHGLMTGRMLEEIEKVLMEEKPDRVLVYGDTNSTLAGALAAAKLHIPVAHVEAGIRSFNMKMPEEINRIITDQLSDFLFCPTDSAVKNLENEGFGLKNAEILQVGDVMHDSAILFSDRATEPTQFDIPENFILATLHRADTTDNRDNLAAIVRSLNSLHFQVAPIVLPLHPRTRAALSRFGLDLKVNVIDPVGYLEMIWLLKACGLVMTDSGGLQKEAFFFGKPCITLRNETEWVELIECGANELVGTKEGQIEEAVKRNYGRVVQDRKDLYGGGRAAERIANALAEN